ncbi:hypothetical protein GCM10010387_25920 [Streptomyces inusitatus]|uniref:Adhesin domain-containing protein n=1 Tax=Streptomyces inusitatus TaxID=68221 RepID=A0A918USW8_9ACTN|nr:DUF4097 family beta strand repeat-containing protein [Streptomyces inusitatus]GGZ30996.1 hypothetical protein GCM10010387_25920 [Streptomyces inusitatus]
MAESTTTWEVAEARRLTFDEPVTALQVHVVNGTVNVVGTEEGSARLEVSRISGPPLTVTQDGSTLTVSYPDLSAKGWLKWLDPKGRDREVTVSLTVPSEASVEVGVVGAAAVVSGVRGRTTVHSVTGDATLVRLSGEVVAETVSGNLEAQSVTGPLNYQSVSGDLTVIEGGAGSRVRADSVSGDMLIDLAATGDTTPTPADIKLNTVTGEVAIRLPHPTDAKVEANTTSGALSNAFDDLRVSGQWGSKKLTGTLGAGTGTLRASTMSGSIALLRRPPADDTDDTDSTDETPGKVL